MLGTRPPSGLPSCLSLGHVCDNGMPGWPKIMMKTKKKNCHSSLHGNITYKNPGKLSSFGGRCRVSRGNCSLLQSERLRVYLNRHTHTKLFLFAQTWVNISPERRAGGGFPWPTAPGRERTWWVSGRQAGLLVRVALSPFPLCHPLEPEAPKVR